MNLLESLNDEMRCEIENHFLDKVQFVCVNEQCTATQRLCCGYCKLRSHFNHPSSLIELSTFTNKILRHTQIVQSKLSTIQGSGESTKFLMNRINERMSGMMQRASQAMNVIVNSAEKTIQQALNQVSSVADDRQISQNACEMQMKLQNIMNRPWERQTNEQIALMAKIYNTENTDNFIEEGCFGGCPDVQGISSYIGSVHDRMEQLFNALFEQITLVLRDTSERIGQIRLAQNSAFPSVRLESNSSSLSPSRQPLLQQGTQTPQMQNNLNISNISKDNVNKHNRLQDDRSFDISQEFIPKSNNNTFLPSFLQTPEQIEQNKIKQTKKGNNQKEFNQLLLRGRFDNLDNSQVNGSNITNNNNSSFVQNQEEDTPRQVRKINNRTPQQQQQFMQTPIMNKQKDQVVDHSKAGRQFRLMSLQDGNSMKDNSINVNPQLTKALQKKDEFQQPTQSQQQQQQQSQQPDLQIISKSPYLSNNYQSSSDRAQLLDRLLVNHKKPGDCARLRLHRRAAPSCLGPSYVTLNNPKKQRHSLSQETPQSTKSVQNNQSTQLNNSNIFNYSQHKQVVKNPNQRFFPHMLGIPQAEQQLHRELYNSSDIVMNKVDLRGNSSNNYNNNNQDNLAAHSLSQKHIDFIQDGQQQQQQNTPMHNGQTAGSTILPRIHIKSRNQIFSGDVPQEYSRSVNYSSQPRQEKLILEQQRTHGKQQQDLRRDLEYQQQQSNEDESLRSSKSLQMSHHKLFQKNTKNRKNKEKQEEEQQQQQDEQEEVEEFQLESNQNEKQQHKKVNAGGQKVQAILPNLEVIERGYEQQQQPIKQTGYQGLSPNKKNNYLNSSSNNNNNKLGQSQQEQSSQYAQSPNPLDVQLQQLKEQQHKLQQILQEKEQNQGQQVLSKSSPKKLKNKQDQQEQYYQSQHQAESQQQYYDDNDQNGQGSIRSSLSQVYNSNNNNNNELQQKRHNNSNDQQLSTIPSQNSTEQPLQFNKRHRKQLQSSDNSRQSKYNQEYSDMDENNNTEMLPNRQQKQYTQEGSRNKRYDDQRKRKNISGDSMEEDEDNYQYQDNNYDNDQEMLTQNNKNKDKKKLNQSKQQNTPVYDSEKEYYITDNVHGQRQLTESQPNRSSQQVLVDDQLTKQGGDQISNSQNRRRYKDGNSSEQVYQKKQKEEQQQQQQYEDSQTADMVEQQQPAKRQRTKPTLYLDPQEQGDYQQQYQDKTNQYVKGEQNSKLSNDPIRSSQKQQQQYFDSFMVSNQTPSTNYDQTAFPAGVNGNTGSISNVTAVHNEFNSYSVLSQGNNNQMQYQNGNNQMHNLFYGENHKILQNEDQSDKNYASDMEQQQQSKNNKKRPSVRRQKQQGQQEMIDQDERGRYSQEQESQQQQQFSSKNQTASFEQQRMSSNGSSGYQGVNDQSRTPMVGSSNNSLQKGQMGNKQQEQYYALEDNKQQEIEVENVGNEQGQRQMIEGSKGKLKTSASVKVQQQQQQQQQQKDRYIPIEGQYQSSALEGNQQNQFKQPFQQQQLQAGNDNITRQQPTLSSQQNLSNQQKVQHQTTQELLNENQNKNMNKDGLQNQQQQQQQQNNQIIQQQQQEQLLSGNTNINSQPNNLASQKILSNQQQPQRTQQVLNENMNNNYPNKVESQLQQPMGSSMNGTGQQHAATQQVQNSRDIATQQVQNSRDIATQNKNMNGLETTQPAGRQEGQNNINNKKDQQAISQVGLNQSQGRQTTTGITAGGVGGVSGVSGITANTNPQSVSAVQNNVPQTLLNQPSYEKSTQLQSQQNPSVQNINGQHLQQQQQQPSLLQRKQTEIMNGTVSQQQQIQPSQQQQLSQGYQQQPSQTYQQQPLEFQQLPGKQLENSANPQLASAQEGSMGLKNQNNNVVDQQNISQKIAQPQEINGIGQQRLGDQQLGQQQIGSSSSSSQVQVGQINQQGDNQLVQQQNGQLQGLKESQQNQISPNNQINIKENEKQKEQQQQQQQQIQQQNQQQQQEQQQKQQELDQKQQQQNNTSPLIQQSLTPQQQITQPSQNQLITTNSIAQQPSNIQPNTAVSSSVQQQQQVQGLQQIQSGQQQVDSQQVSQKLNQQQQQQLQQSQQKLPQQKNDKHNSKGDLLDNQLGQQQVQSQQQQEIQPVQTSSVQNSQQQQASDSVAKIDTQQPSAVNSIQNKQIDSTIGQQQQQQLGNKTQELNGNTSSQIGQQQQQQIKSNEIVGEQQLKQQSDSIKPDILQGGNQIQPNNTNITSVNKDGVSVSEKGQLKAPQQDSQGIQQEEQKVIDQGKDINNQLDQDPMKKNGNIPTDSQQQQQQNLTSSQNKLNQLSQQQQSPSGQQQQQQQSQSHLIQQSQISEVIKKSRRVIQPPIPDYPQEFKASEYQIQVSNNPLEFLTNPIENDMKTLKINKPPYGWIPQKQYPHKFAALQTLKKTQDKYGYLNIPEKLDKQSRLMLQQAENNQIFYDGEWLKGERHGKGTQIMENGSIYQGQWENGHMSGKGRLITKENNVYEGDLVENMIIGKGVMHFADGTEYYGNWKDNNFEGFGKKQWPEGAYYQGMFVAGVKQGKGTFIWDDGSYFQGDFEANKFNGKGTYQWKNSRRYEGDWKDGKMDGQGREESEKGIIYEGAFKDDKKHGFGVLILNEKKRYEGNWEYDKPKGQGVLIDNGVSQAGIWSDGKFYRENV